MFVSGAQGESEHWPSHQENLRVRQEIVDYGVGRECATADSRRELRTIQRAGSPEVLEHVEEPDRFLRRLAELAAPGAYIYVTTCINAPAIDHIHLWRNTDDLEGLIKRCGLTIRTALRLPYEGKTIMEAVEQNLAINVAYVLEAA